MNGLAPLDYGTVRRRWCAAALRALLRRWGIAIAVALVVLGSGASAGLSGMGGMLALAVYPLFDALGRPLPQQLLQTLAHSLLGALLLLALRPLLWPRAWAEAEAALPLPRTTLRRSDLAVLAWALAPLLLTYAAGTASWLAALPAHTPIPRGRLLALLALSAGLSLGWGLLMLHLTRWPPVVWRTAGWRRALERAAPEPAARGHAASRSAAQRRPPAAAGAGFTIGSAGPAGATADSAASNWAATAAAGAASGWAGAAASGPRRGAWAAHWAWVLVALPLWRGPAARAGRLLLLASTTLATPVLALALWPRGGAWWLAALAAAGMALTARLHAVITADLAPLHQACVALPLDGRPLRRARLALALLPIVLALALAAVVVLALPLPVRPAVLAAYGAASLGFNLLQLVWASHPDASKPSTRITFWLLMQVCLLALASESLR